MKSPTRELTLYVGVADRSGGGVPHLLCKLPQSKDVAGTFLQVVRHLQQTFRIAARPPMDFKLSNIIGWLPGITIDSACSQPGQDMKHRDNSAQLWTRTLQSTGVSSIVGCFCFLRRGVSNYSQSEPDRYQEEVSIVSRARIRVYSRPRQSVDSGIMPKPTTSETSRARPTAMELFACLEITENEHASSQCGYCLCA